MIEITNNEDALTLALVLAVTASSDEQAKEANELAKSFASGMTEKQVETCKMAAEVVIDCQNKISKKGN